MLNPGLKDTLNGTTDVQLVDEFGVPINPATEAKQDSQIALETALNTLITVLNSTVTTNDKTHSLLYQIRDALTKAVDIDKSTNAKRIIPVGGTVSTVTTVGTVTNQTNIGGYSADRVVKDSSNQSWALSIRNRMI